MKIFTFYFRVLVALLGIGWLGLRPQQAQAQTYSLPASGTASYTTCSGTLYDGGGANGNYAPNTDGSVTLIPATTGNKIKLEFTSFALEVNYDFVYVYDGSSTTAPLIGRYTGGTLPGIIYASTTSGTLTVRLTSDEVYQAAGFSATISCVTALPQADLTVQSASLSPTTLVPGGSATASATIANLSGVQASSSSMGYYLSTDNVLSSEDVLVASSSGGSLAAGTSATRNAAISIPIGTATGSYYMLFVADYLNQVPESNETNNVSSVALTIQTLAPDLTITQTVASPASIATGAPLSLSYYINNVGNAQASSSSVGFYLSTNTTLDANDQLLSSQFGSSLVANGSTQRYATVTLPSSATPGSYYILYAADYQNLVTESNENNNVASAAITVVASGPDLVVTQQGLYSSSAPAGSSLVANAYVYNQGNQSASSSNLGFYLSTNTTFDASDVLLTTSSGGTLAAYTSASRAATLTIPANTTPGSYYLLYVADPTNLVAESVETNNVASSALTIVASSVDLSFYSVYLSSTQVLAGSTISPSSTLYNSGNIAASPATVGYYLSTNNTLDANDVLIGNTSLSYLAGGNYGYPYGSATIPAGTAAGSYYVLFVADYLNQITETSETNNVSAVSITVTTPSIDLLVSGAYTSPSQTMAGNTINTGGYLYNQGNTIANPARVGFYLSTNNTLDANDVLIGNYSLGSVSAGSYGSIYGSATIPTGTAAGSYYVLFVADYLNQLTETNENNNVSAVSLTVVTPSVDLLVSSPYVSPSQTVAGNTINTSSYLYNQGNVTASPATIGYYLSTNNTLDANDILIGNSSLNSVTSGSYSIAYGTATIPAGTAAGSYYVLFVADYLNQLAESNESNNVNSTAISVATPSVDLYFPYSSGLSTSQAFSGTTISSTCYLYNQGNTAASPATVGYYLSTNTTFDAGDVLIGNSSASSVSPGTYSTQYGSLTIPATTPSGSYYVLFVADYLNQLAESNENNNVASAALQVTVSTVDLYILSPVATPTTVNNGGTIATNCFIFNAGTTTSSSSTVGYYLSTNDSFDASDVLLTTSTGGSLVSGTTSLRTTSVTIPTTTSSGTYYLLFVADPNGAVAESNETNNVAPLPITVNSNFNGYIVPVTGSNTITACSGTVYDNGGTDNYVNNSNGTLTIRPGTAGLVTQLVFSSFATEQGYDYLRVYDGLDTNAPLLGSYSGSISIPSTIRASSTNTSGALTLRFSSDNVYSAAGFQATISCVQPQVLTAREQTAGYDLSVFPNPVSAAPLRVQLSGLGARTEATLTLRNSLGQLVVTRSLALLPGRLNQTEIETTGLATGVYLLQLTGTDLNATRRVVIE